MRSTYSPFTDLEDVWRRSNLISQEVKCTILIRGDHFSPCLSLPPPPPPPPPSSPSPKKPICFQKERKKKNEASSFCIPPASHLFPLHSFCSLSRTSLGERERGGGGERETETDRPTDRQRGRQTEKQRDRQRQTERQRDRQR